MSKKKSYKYKSKKNPSERLWIRLLCAFLGLLMVLAIVFMLASIKSVAADTNIKIENGKADIIDIGLFYGESSVQNYFLNFAGKFDLSENNKKIISDESDSSLVFGNSGKCVYYGDEFIRADEGTVISDYYHIDISSFSVKGSGDSFSNKDNPVFILPNKQDSSEVYSNFNINNVLRINDYFNQIDVVKNSELYSFVFFNSGSYSLRYGQFGSSEDAQNALDSLKKTVNLNAKIVKSVETDFIIINSLSKKVIYEISTPSDSMRLTAESGNYSDNQGRLYKGYFKFFIDSKRLAMKVICSVNINDYLDSIMTYELPGDINETASKALSVVLRSYVYGLLRRHSADGFDVCTDNHCHVFEGLYDNSSFAENISETGKEVLSGFSDFSGYYFSAAADKENVSLWKTSVGNDEIQLSLENVFESDVGVIKEIKKENSTSSDFPYVYTIIDSRDNEFVVRDELTFRKIFGKYLTSINFSLSDDNIYSASPYSKIYLESLGIGNGIGVDLQSVILYSSGEDYKSCLISALKK